MPPTRPRHAIRRPISYERESDLLIYRGGGFSSERTGSCRKTVFVRTHAQRGSKKINKIRERQKWTKKIDFNSSAGRQKKLSLCVRIYRSFTSDVTDDNRSCCRIGADRCCLFVIVVIRTKSFAKFRVKLAGFLRRKKDVRDRQRVEKIFCTFCYIRCSFINKIGNHKTGEVCPTRCIDRLVPFVQNFLFFGDIYS